MAGPLEIAQQHTAERQLPRWQAVVVGQEGGCAHPTRRERFAKTAEK